MKFLCGFLTFCVLFQPESLTGQNDPSRLLGSWQLHLWVTGPAASSAGPSMATGKLRLKRLNGDSGSTAHPDVYSVNYSKSLHAMFGEPKFGPAQALLTSAGMIQLLFNPFVDHGAFRLRGRIDGDSITGEWHRTNFADDGYRGAFTMVRQR